MVPTGANDWVVTGIPVTPLDDQMNLNPYPLAKIEVVADRRKVATTSAVVPVSWEISCNLCHAGSGAAVDQDILADHDRLHGTRLQASKPVLCARCHADPRTGDCGSGRE